MEELESYRPLLFAIAYRMTGSASEAEDLVQESFPRFLGYAAWPHPLAQVVSDDHPRACVPQLPQVDSPAA